MAEKIVLLICSYAGCRTIVGRVNPDDDPDQNHWCTKHATPKKRVKCLGWRQRLTREAAEDAGLGGPPYPSDYKRGAN